MNLLVVGYMQEEMKKRWACLEMFESFVQTHSEKLVSDLLENPAEVGELESILVMFFQSLKKNDRNPLSRSYLEAFKPHLKMQLIN